MEHSENLTENALTLLENIKNIIKKKDEDIDRQRLVLSELKQQHDSLLSENQGLKFKVEELRQESTAKDLKHRNEMQSLIDRAKKNNEDSHRLVLSLDLRVKEAEARADEAEEKSKKLFEDIAGTMNRALSSFPSLSQSPFSNATSLSASPLLRRSFTVPPSRSPSPTKHTSKRPLKENRTPDREAKKLKQEIPPFHRRGMSMAPELSAGQRIGFSPPHRRAVIPTSPVPDSEEAEPEAESPGYAVPMKPEPASSPQQK